MDNKKIILKKNFNGIIYNLLIGSHTDIIKDRDGNTLTDILNDFAKNSDLEELKNRFNTLVEGAPELYDTLKEVGDWIEEHQDVYINLITSLANKVDKEDGKGLSSNDFTDDLKEKVVNDYTKDEIDKLMENIPSGDTSIICKQIEPNTSLNDYSSEGFYYYMPEDENYKDIIDFEDIINGDKINMTDYTDTIWDTLRIPNAHTLFDNKTTVYVNTNRSSPPPGAFSFYGLLIQLKYNGINYYGMFTTDEFLTLKRTYAENKSIDVFTSKMRGSIKLYYPALDTNKLNGGTVKAQSGVLNGIEINSSGDNMQFNILIDNYWDKAVFGTDYVYIVNNGATGNIIMMTVDDDGELKYTTYGTNGRYCFMNSTVDTITNKPTRYPFFMIVGRHSGFSQIAIEDKLYKPNIYVRNYNGESYGNWENINANINESKIKSLILDYLTSGKITSLNTQNKNIISAINEIVETLSNGITIDNELSSESTNPVQNRVITDKFDDYYDKATIDRLNNKISIELIPLNSDLNNYKEFGFYNGILSNEEAYSEIMKKFMNLDSISVTNNTNTDDETRFTIHDSLYSRTFSIKKSVLYCLKVDDNLYVSTDTAKTFVERAVNYDKNNDINIYINNRRVGENVAATGIGYLYYRSQDTSITPNSDYLNGGSCGMVDGYYGYIEYQFIMNGDTKDIQFRHYHYKMDSYSANLINSTESKYIDIYNLGRGLNIYFGEYDSTTKQITWETIGDNKEFTFLNAEDSTILNKPTLYSFFMLVYKSNNTYQHIYDNSGKTYTRYLSDDTWSAWTSDYTKSEIDTKLNQVFQSVSNGKQLLASAITDKGIKTSNDATFQVMANNIKNLSALPKDSIRYGNILSTKINPRAAVFKIRFKAFFYANKGRNYIIKSNDTETSMTNSTIAADDNGISEIKYTLENLNVGVDNEIVIKSNTNDIYFYNLIELGSFEFGNASLNTTNDSYKNKVYFYNPTTGENAIINASTSLLPSFPDHTYYFGNFDTLLIESNSSNGKELLVYRSKSNKIPASSYTEITFDTPVIGDETFTIGVTFYGGMLWRGLSFKEFKLNLDGNYYTLSDAVISNKIKPMVLFCSASYEPTYSTNIFNWYTGDSAGGDFCKLQCHFIIESDVKFSGVKFYNDGTENPDTGDYFCITKIPYLFNYVS